MRKTPRHVLAALAVVVALSLGGCVPQDPNVKPAPAPSATPAFASDDAALAAATKAYSAYVAMSDQIAQEGGVHPERLKDLVTPSWLKKEVSSFQRFASTGNRQAGKTKLDHISLEQLQQGALHTSVAIYVCLDLSDTRILDPSNVDVTPARPTARAPFEAVFTSPTGKKATLVLSGNDPWSGKNFC